MSAKPELSGHRAKQRKRNVIDAFDSGEFLSGLHKLRESVGDSFEKYGQAIGADQDLDYKRYADYLFDDLICGGIGILCDLRMEESAKDPHELSLFGCSNENFIPYVDVLCNIIAKKAYLKLLLNDKFAKLMDGIDSLSEGHLSKLMGVTAVLTEKSILIPGIAQVDFWCVNFLSTSRPRLIAKGFALNFILGTVKKYADLFSPDRAMEKVIRSNELSTRLLELMPVERRSVEEFEKECHKMGLDFLIEDERKRRSVESYDDVLSVCVNRLHHWDEELEKVSSSQAESLLLAQGEIEEAISKIDPMNRVKVTFDAIVRRVKFGGKSSLQTAEVMRVLTRWGRILKNIVGNSYEYQVTLLLQIQQTCYSDMRMLSSFGEIVKYLYENDIIYEDVIRVWFKKGGDTRGFTVFKKQLEDFIHWLEVAEEEDE
ncbi:basic leucine zipper and W2 domain-containing protein 2 [Aduncisulcus paluster]|uniref:Basic leucine zipper and W2 domain-containing protein 2 n=1 Tax=Aduncisulcus paluster TaxID=2918883 RepID=A0ABQ5JS61_9EUKA|nr:basic leucine zipper and W2 domain-containing protein 2 [Aduncisulcus paluster]